MAKFWDLIERSIIVQSMLPLIFGGACVALWLQSKVVPDALLQLTWVCCAFWMGAKTQHINDIAASKKAAAGVTDLRAAGK